MSCTAPPPSTPVSSTRQSALVRSLALFVFAGVVLYLAAILWNGWGPTTDALRAIDAFVLAAGGALACITYVLRFARWHYSLQVLTARVPVVRSFGIYLTGLALTTTPGKVGETFRTVLLLPLGIPAKSSLGAFLADRLSDVLGVCLLATLAGLWAGKVNRIVFGALLLIGVASFVFRYLVQSPQSSKASVWLNRHAHRLPLRVGADALQSWAYLWTPRRVAAFALTAMCAYGVQGLVFAWLCGAAGFDMPVAVAVGIYASSTLFGAASMVPGGLGTMEASMVFQLQSQGVTASLAIPVAIATRALTLWLGMALGLIALLLVSRK